MQVPYTNPGVRNRLGRLGTLPADLPPHGNEHFIGTRQDAQPGSGQTLHRRRRVMVSVREAKQDTGMFREQVTAAGRDGGKFGDSFRFPLWRHSPVTGIATCGAGDRSYSQLVICAHRKNLEHVSEYDQRRRRYRLETCAVFLHCWRVGPARPCDAGFPAQRPRLVFPWIAFETCNQFGDVIEMILDLVDMLADLLQAPVAHACALLRILPPGRFTYLSSIEH
jgi:hypothetical protein